MQFQAACDHVVKLMGSASVADRLIKRVLAYFDDPTPRSFTVLNFTGGHA